MSGPSLATRMLELVRAENISQNEFARRVCSSSAFISNIICGKTVPGFEFTQRICMEFGVSANWLVIGEGPMYLDQKQGVNLDVFQTLTHAVELTRLAVFGEEDAEHVVKQFRDGSQLAEMPYNLIGKISSAMAVPMLAAQLYNEMLPAASRPGWDVDELIREAITRLLGPDGKRGRSTFVFQRLTAG